MRISERRQQVAVICSCLSLILIAIQTCGWPRTGARMLWQGTELLESKSQRASLKGAVRQAASAEATLLKEAPIVQKTADELETIESEAGRLRNRLATALQKETELDQKLIASELAAKRASSRQRSATAAVSDAEDALSQVRDIAKLAASLHRNQTASAEASQIQEGRGLAEDHAGELLLGYSQQLNQQGIAAMRQAPQDPEAKALAALDLRESKQLADHASRTMAVARQRFSAALAYRRTAAADQTSLTRLASEAARISVADNGHSAALDRVLRGRRSAAAIVAGVKEVDTAALAAGRESLDLAQRDLAAAASATAAIRGRRSRAQARAAGLRSRLSAEQGAAVAAAKRHLAAAAAMRAAAADDVTAEAAADRLRRARDAALATALRDTQDAQLRASSRSVSASGRLIEARESRRRLEVKVARLTEQLKASKLEKDLALRKRATEARLARRLLRRLRARDTALSTARLRLAAHGLYAGRGLAAAAAGDADSDLASDGGGGGGGGGAEGGADADAAAAVRGAVAEERLSQHRHTLAQRRAMRRADQETARLQAAQLALASQLARVRHLESDITFH